jgi:hypothetical protein
MDECLLQVLTYECKSVADFVKCSLPKRLEPDIFGGVGEYPLVFAVMSTLNGQHTYKGGPATSMLYLSSSVSWEVGLGTLRKCLHGGIQVSSPSRGEKSKRECDPP